MTFLTFGGKKKEVSLNRYRIVWDGKSRSKFQQEVKQFLKRYWLTQAVYEEMPVAGTRMKIDIYNANKRLAVEVDGAQHDKFNKHFHKDNRILYSQHIGRDIKKEDWCELNSITLIRIKPEDLPLSKSFFDNLGVNL